jgi:hypothetical protein
MVKKTDDNGLDLYFASESKPIHSNRSSTLAKAAQRRKPVSTLLSNLLHCLAVILQNYKIGMLSKKRLNIYIFTTGNWSDESPGGRIEEPIRELVRHLVDDLHQSDRRVAIQLIQFGDNSRGTARLEYLDKLKRFDSTVKMSVILYEKFPLHTLTLTGILSTTFYHRAMCGNNFLEPTTTDSILQMRLSKTLT